MQRDAVERLYSELGPGLLAYASSLLGDRARAEDVVQQVFLKLLDRRAAEPGKPAAYLYSAVRNAALNVLRATARDVGFDSNEPWFEAPPGRSEAGLALKSALQQLPPEQREVIMMKIWGGMTLEEIGIVLGVPPNTAASRYRYGLAKLRQQLGAFASR